MYDKDWLETQYLKIEKHTESYSISKYNLLKISFLKRLLEESLNHAATCNDCASNLPQLEKMIDAVPLLDDIEHRQPYEKKFNETRRHFHKKHQFISPYFLSTRWTIGGVIAGSAIAVAISIFVNGNVLIDPVLAGVAGGLIIGYLIGSTMEARYRKTKRII